MVYLQSSDEETALKKLSNFWLYQGRDLPYLYLIPKNMCVFCFEMCKKITKFGLSAEQGYPLSMDELG